MGTVSFLIERPEPVPTEGLVAYWKMDAIDGGTSILDYSGNANNLTINGSPSVVSGLSGNAIRFGSGDEAERNTNLGLTYDMALSMFVKFNAINSTNEYRQILTFCNEFELNSGMGLVKIYGASRVHMCRSRVGGSAFSNNVHEFNISGSGHTPLVDTWYHYFIQKNELKTEFWVDAVNIVDKVWNNAGSFNSDAETFMQGHDDRCDMTVEHVRVYDLTSRGPMSQAEINQLYTEI